MSGTAWKSYFDRRKRGGKECRSCNPSSNVPYKCIECLNLTIDNIRRVNRVGAESS